MNAHEVCNPFLVAMRAEHRDIHVILTSLREQFEAVASERTAHWLPTLRQRLDDLRECLAAHFAAEEAGGCLDEAVAHLPRLGEAVTQIEHEHSEILARLDKLRERAAADLPTQDRIGLAAAFGEFETQLRRHEACEDAVLAQGFNEPTN
jgi:hypothetical protein